MNIYEDLFIQNKINRLTFLNNQAWIKENAKK